MKILVHNLVLASTLLLAAIAHAQTVITALPYTISKGGTYVLNSDLNYNGTSGNLITVDASNVTIDFQGHYIAGPVGVTNQSVYGINASERSNITVKNGTIAFCYTGILIAGNGQANTNNVGHQIENMRMTYCYTFGIFVSQSPATRITNCQVSQCGHSGASVAYGIVVQRPGIMVSDCIVSAINATYSFGISVDPGSFARQNSVSNCTYGISGGKYQDNLTYGCTYPVSNGTDAGGNN